MDALRITAARAEDGELQFEAYDASELFEQGTELLDQGRCEEAVATYDRLVEEFEDSRYLSVALYNGGFCLSEQGAYAEAAARYEALLERVPDSPDAKHAALQLAEAYHELARWEALQELVKKLLAREDLSVDERMEALARRAQALLGEARWEEARKEARAALTYYRTRPEEEPVRALFFVAAANYVVADALRQQAQAMEFPEAGVEAQREVLTERAELLLEAQREYFNTIRHTQPYWAAAAGYRIGHMYDELWHAIMEAPVPPHLPEAGRSVYREELAKLVKPLIRHAIRYWELTLMMIERTGLQSDWTEQTQQDLDRMRELLLEQPLGPGGLRPEAEAGEPEAEAGDPEDEEDTKVRDREHDPEP